MRAALASLASNTNVDTLPRDIFSHVRERMRELGITTRRMAALRGTAYGGDAHFGFAPSRATVLEYAELLDDAHLRAQASSDLFWDRITGIADYGYEDVYDLTEPLMGFFRRFIPPLGGLDLSPIFIFIMLNIVIGVVCVR